MKSLEFLGKLMYTDYLGIQEVEKIEMEK